MKIKLSQAFDLQMGKTPSRDNSAYWGGKNKWISIADLNNTRKYIEDTKESITNIGVTDSGIKSVPSGTVVMSFKLSIGKTAITAEEMYTNEAIMAFLDKGVFEIDTNYFYHLCCGMDWTRGTNKAVKGLTLNKASLSQVEIDIPKISEQKNIAEKLDKIDSMISLQQKNFYLLDCFIKSRFIELFGDPYKNPFNWKRSTIANVMRAPASNGFFAKPDDYSENGNVGVIFVADVVNRKYSNIANLRKTTVSDRDLDKYRVQYGDMLFCRSSLVKEGIGKASVIPENAGKDIIFECHVIRIPLDMNVVIPEFMQALSVTDYFRNMMMSNSKTATMTTIGQKGIITAEIYIPPIELQKEFLLFNKQIDKSKLAIQKSLEKLVVLKKSLMQQYFG